LCYQLYFNNYCQFKKEVVITYILKTIILIILFLYSNFTAKSALSNRELVDSLLSEVTEAGKDTNAVKLYNTLSFSYHIFDTDSGLSYGNISLRLAEDLDWKKGIAGARNSLAANYITKSMTSEATMNYLKALSIYEDIEDKRGILKSYGNMSMLYSIIKRYDIAIDYYHKSISMAKELNSDRDLARNYGNLSSVYKLIKNIDSSKYYIKKSIEMNEKLDKKDYLVINYLNLGAISIDDSSYTDAYKYTMKSLSLAKDMNNKRIIATCYANFGNIYKMSYYYPHKFIPRPDFLLSNPKLNLLKSIEFLEKARAAFSEMNDRKSLMEVCDYLFEVRLLNNNFHEAAQIRQKYYDLQDSVLNEETKKQIALLDAKSELDQKDQQLRMYDLEIEAMSSQLVIIGVAFVAIAIIAIIFYRLNNQKQKINKKLREQSIIISDQVATKDKFFSIIAHDLKNPIASMAQSIELINNEFDRFDVSELKEFLDVLENSSKNASALLEDLLTWSRSQRGMIEAYKEVYNAKDTAARAISQLEPQASLKKIDIINNIENDQKVYLDANLTITILRNLISNAIKFSQIGSIIEVSFRKSNNGFSSYQVRDYGMGMDTKTLDSMFRIESAQSGVGTAGERGTGLGLIVCKEFADKQNGNIFVTSKLGEGSIFTFEIPDDSGNK